MRTSSYFSSLLGQPKTFLLSCQREVCDQLRRNALLERILSVIPYDFFSRRDMRQ